jgi:hypothetical protein
LILFELVTPDSGPHEMITHENSRSWLGGAKSCFNGQNLVKKLCVSDPKMIFAKKKLGGRLISAKVQTHPSFSEIGRSL